MKGAITADRQSDRVDMMGQVGMKDTGVYAPSIQNSIRLQSCSNPIGSREKGGDQHINKGNKVGIGRTRTIGERER